MIIDVHAHYNDERYNEDLDQLMNTFRRENIYVINSATCPGDIDSAVSLANKYSNMFVTVGIHPEYALESNDLELQKISNLFTDEKNNKLLGIGETGLDYHYDYSEEQIAAQKVNFIKHLKLASELSKPIVVHNRDAHLDTMTILKEHLDTKRGALIHCYSGSSESVPEYVSMNCCFSIGGVVTFKNAKKLVEAVKAMPHERILIETDCPYLTPEPFRGTRNDSGKTVYTIRKIAELLDLSYEYVCDMTADNAKRFFEIDCHMY